jgi:predicted PurR-regulated permease PerM
MPERDGPVPGHSWLDRHLWQIQPVRDMLVVLGVLGFFWLGYRLSVVTVPLLLAVTLAYLFEPVVRYLLRTRWVSRDGAAAMIIVTAVLAIVVPVGVGGPFAVAQGLRLVSDIRDQGNNLSTAIKPENRNELAVQAAVEDGFFSWVRDLILREQDKQAEREAARAQELEEGREDRAPGAGTHEPQTQVQTDAAGDVPGDGGVLPPAGGEAAEPTGGGDPFVPAAPRFEVGEPSELGEVAVIVIDFLRNNAEAITQRVFRTGAGAFEALVSTAASIGYVAFTLFLTGFFFFFFSVGYPRVLVFGEKLVPDAHRPLVMHLLRRFDAVISGFVRGRLTIAFVQSFVFTLGYWVIGVPAPILLGVGVAVLSIVPYAAMIGIPVSITLLWIEGHSGFRGDIWWVLAAPVVIYFLGQALDDYLWTPLIQGKSTGMDTPTILFATLAGGALMGVYGLLLAIPLAACLKILLEEIFWPRFKQWAAGETPDFLPIARE